LRCAFAHHDSLSALIDPGAEKSNLIGCERFRRLEITWAARRPACRIVCRPAGRKTAGTCAAAFAGAAFWGHGGIVIDASSGDDNKTAFTIARFNYFAVVTSFQDAVEAIEAEARQ